MLLALHAHCTSSKTTIVIQIAHGQRVSSAGVVYNKIIIVIIFFFFFFIKHTSLRMAQTTWISYAAAVCIRSTMINVLNLSLTSSCMEVQQHFGCLWHFKVLGCLLLARSQEHLARPINTVWLCRWRTIEFAVHYPTTFYGLTLWGWLYELE